jgi:hypothetical protein
METGIADGNVWPGSRPQVLPVLTGNCRPCFHPHFICWLHDTQSSSGRFKEERNFLSMPLSKLDPSVFYRVVYALYWSRYFDSPDLPVILTNFWIGEKSLNVSVWKNIVFGLDMAGTALHNSGEQPVKLDAFVSGPWSRCSLEILMSGNHTQIPAGIDIKESPFILTNVYSLWQYNTYMKQV